jgi:hypothetical protein
MTWRILGSLAGAIAIVGVVVALLAPSDGTAIDPVAQAADVTAAAGTAEFGLAGSLTAEGQRVQISGSGALDMRNGRMRMSMSFPMPGYGSMEMDELFDGTAFYLKFPDALAQRIPGGKPWMKIDLQTLGKSAGVDLKQLMQANQNNPADMLKALKGVGTSRLIGPENIRGSATNHYRAEIDLKKAAARIPDSASAAALKRLVGASTMSAFPIDVWIDRVGRVRREQFQYSANGVGMDMTIEFTRFGLPVDTTPPPSDQVLDAAALLGAASTTSG